MLRTAVFWFALVSMGFLVWAAYSQFHMDLRCLTRGGTQMDQSMLRVLCSNRQLDIWGLFGYTLAIMACGFVAFWSRPDIEALRKYPRWD